jgi:hypothetical protein
VLSTRFRPLTDVKQWNRNRNCLCIRPSSESHDDDQQGVTLNKSDWEQERELFRQLADGSLPESEFSAVEQRLRTDVGFRERYIRAMDVEGALYATYSVLGRGAVPGTSTVSVFRVMSKVKLFSMVAAGTAVFYGVAAWLLWMSPAPRPNAQELEHGQLSQTPVAAVTRAQQLDKSQQTSFEPGMLAIPGVLKIDRGQIQLEFLNRAQVRVEGTVELHLLSADSATLISGKAAVRVPPGARSFVLNTPDVSIENTGAEFAIAVDKHGASEIRVLSGEISVSLLKNDGNTATTLTVAEPNSLRINRNPSSLEPIDAPTVDLPVVEAQIPPHPRIRTRHCNILPFPR